MFPEPNIYAFAPHIFCIQNWRCNLYYLNLAYLIARSAPFIIQLLPICCQYMYADFVSVVRGALCIIMASPFIPYPSTYLGKCSLLPILYNRLRRRLHSIPKYISRKVKATANIYIIEYAEAFIFSDTSTCLLFTISIYCWCMYANFTSEVGDAICIIVASPFIPYPTTY